MTLITNQSRIPTKFQSSINNRQTVERIRKENAVLRLKSKSKSFIYKEFVKKKNSKKFLTIPEELFKKTTKEKS